MEPWKKHVCRVGKELKNEDTLGTDPEKARKDIEPWLTAVFQSEHFALLTGSGFTTAVAVSAGSNALNMGLAKFGCSLEDKLNEYAAESATRTGRGNPNIEDQIRAANALIAGLSVQKDKKAAEWEKALNQVLAAFAKAVLTTEKAIRDPIETETDKGNVARSLLESFLLSFASRSASRERLNIFTTNYDRLLEYGCDLIGLHMIDRFVGALSPVFRSSRLDLDLHYNPPGIRGEPRFLEGVVKLTKLHGSIDWQFANSILRRYAIPFGAEPTHPDLPKDVYNRVMIYPNPAKDVETLEYPYAELFRDFSAALCRPNSVLVTYGYGFGDDHVNRIIRDMLTIPSTHLVIMSYDDVCGRIQRFCEKAARDAQISLLIGDHYASLPTLVEHYLPKPAIDLITIRKQKVLENRGEAYPPKVAEEKHNADTH